MTGVDQDLVRRCYDAAAAAAAASVMLLLL
jgi:hypothetical protein